MRLAIAASVLLLCASVAQAQPITFIDRMDNLQEVPATPGVPSIGVSYGTLDATNTIVTTFQHDVMSPVAAHIHGPAGPGVNAGVQVPFPGGASPSSVTFMPTMAQQMMLVGGQLYVNVHSTPLPAGEIRGQIANLFAPQVFINEYCNDPFGATGLDTNRDGTPATSGSQSNDEFVEIVNGTSAPVDISGWTVSDAVSLRHTFDVGTVLPPFASITVFGGGSVATFNTGPSVGVTASSGALGLNNGADSITLADATAAVVDMVSWTSGGAGDGDGESVNRRLDSPNTTFGVISAVQVAALPAVFTPPITTHSPGLFLDATFAWPRAVVCGDGVVSAGLERCDDGALNGTPLSCCDATCNLRPTGAACDDALFCTATDVCDAAGACVGGGATCDDAVGCTVDTCDEAAGSCSNAPDDAACDNGLFCDGVETCDATLDCQAGTPVACGDAVGCTVDSCDEAADACVNAPDDTACDNGLFCDGRETCDATLDCQVGVPVACGDAVACTVDTCNEAIDACVNAPDDTACDNGLFCDGRETCDATLDCQRGTPVACGDAVSCTVDSCDEAADACVNAPDDTACDNGLFCDGRETCDATLDCQRGTLVACGDSVGCTVDSCDEAADACVNAPDDTRCDNGTFCDGAETCDATLDCQSGTAPSCDDGLSCTVDTCSSATDACASTPDDTLCDNGMFCDGAETCDATLGCQAAPAPCDDAVACTTDTCDETLDTCANAPDDAACADADLCNGAEVCDATLGCQPGTPLVCDDADMCNGAETCDAAMGCQAGVTLDCDDGDPCTTDECAPASGCMSVADLCLDGGAPDAGMSVDDGGVPDGGGADDGGVNRDGGALPDGSAPDGGDIDPTDGGCSCRAAGGPGDVPGAPWLALVAVALLWRRRGRS